MAFPTLKYNGIEITQEDNAIKSQPQDGKVITRKKYTSTRKTITFSMPLVAQSYADALQAFYDTVETYLSFQWIHPRTAVIYTVRFEQPIKITNSASAPDLYSVESVTLKEV